jgi:hypothetical protein
VTARPRVAVARALCVGALAALAAASCSRFATAAAEPSPKNGAPAHDAATLRTPGAVGTRLADAGTARPDDGAARPPDASGRPICVRAGTRSEGWAWPSGRFIRWSKCKGVVPRCQPAGGSKDVEGWYAKGLLIAPDRCMKSRRTRR